jgi:preprotein translocase subunit SecD
MNRWYLRIDMRTLVVIIGVIAAGLASTETAQGRCESIQVRFVNETPPRGAHRYRERSTGESYALTDTVALDGRGIQDVSLDPFKNGLDTVWTVVANVKATFARAMSTLVAAHRDGHLGVLMGNELVQTAVIAGPLTSRVPLRIMTSKPIADSLARRVRAAIAPQCMTKASP